MVFVEPLPFVRRLIFIATPQHGSYFAGNRVSHWVARFVTLPLDLVRVGTDLLTFNREALALTVGRAAVDQRRQHDARQRLHPDARGDSGGSRRRRRTRSSPCAATARPRRATTASSSTRARISRTPSPSSSSSTRTRVRRTRTRSRRSGGSCSSTWAETDARPGAAAAGRPHGPGPLQCAAAACSTSCFERARSAGESVLSSCSSTGFTRSKPPAALRVSQAWAATRSFSTPRPSR